MFGLLNANARLYNPYLGRFISPDPLLNSEGGPLDYNPYIYARNNPYKYIDRNGEFPWLIAAFAAFATAGGVANVVSNWSDIHNFGEGLGFFCLGAGVTAATLAGAAVLGTAAACAAPYIAGVLGVAAESAVALGTAYAAAGAVYYVYEGCLNSAVYGNPFEFSWNGLTMTMATWGIPAGVGGYMLARAKGLNGWTGLEKSNVMATRHRPIVTGPDAMAAMAEAEKPVSTVSEYVRPETITWEIDCGRRFPDTMLSDGNSVRITRPAIKGYILDLEKKTDLYHQFPKIFDKFVVERGISRTVGNSSSYVLPGRCNGNPGFFQVNINNKTGTVYHRDFYKYADRGQMYVKCGKEKVFFFK